MNKKLLVIGAIFGLMSIVLGAFAAHGLEKIVDAESIDSFKTGVRYQMYHALLALILGGTSFIGTKSKMAIFYLIIFGVLFFSGSIYGLATNELSSFDFKTIAIITPIGGLLLIVAWGVMLVDLLKNKEV